MRKNNKGDCGFFYIADFQIVVIVRGRVIIQLLFFLALMGEKLYKN